MYELFYWPGIQGRGEFVRLALEDSGAEYLDICRLKGRGRGVAAMTKLMEEGARPSFAPPFLRDGEAIVGQTANILLYLGPRLGLAPMDEAGRLWTHQIQLTIADCVGEAHDAHHPVSVGLYYEDQRPEALRRAEAFREDRIPKFLDWFETALARNPAGPDHLVGDAATYVDLSLFQLVAGLSYAFPKAAGRALRKRPRVAGLAAAVARRPGIAAYLSSNRRLPFNEQGIFRRYPELDA